MMDPLILIVDDEVSFVDAIAKRLRKRNVTVFTANSGEEALKVLDTNKNLDVAIVDVKMPGMDGIETLKEMKKKVPLTEVIMLTGHATVETSIEGMKLGAFDYLLKPYDVDQLLEKVNQATRKKRDHENKIRDAMVKESLTRHGLE